MSIGSAIGELTIDTLKAFMERHYLKNRTIVSNDIPGILDDIESITGLPLIRHSFRTGEDHGSWIVPPRWDVRKAWLKDARGRVLASYGDHPLFVCPYSVGVHKTLSKDELLLHCTSEPRQPDAYSYNWRYAMDYNKRLQGWGITLPHRLLEQLDNGPFEILIDVDVDEGEMLVGEICLPGRTEDSFMFLADYCHPGQVNDSFSGLAVLMQVMHTLAQMPERKFTYRFLILPETIGAAVYIAKDPSRVKDVFGVLFSEAVGWGEQWYIKSSRHGGTYLDQLSEECRVVFQNVKAAAFCDEDPARQIYGNDELIFDSVHVNIPSLAVQKFPFQEYHTSFDEPSKIVDADLHQAYDMICHMIIVLEKDGVYRFTGPVPFWMARYDLYSDTQYELLDNRFRFSIVYRLLDSKRSLLEIANHLGVPFQKVYSFVMKMEGHGLVKLVDCEPGCFYNFKNQIS